jgi:hypothetical protein
MPAGQVSPRSLRPLSAEENECSSLAACSSRMLVCECPPSRDHDSIPEDMACRLACNSTLNTLQQSFGERISPQLRDV